MKLRKGRSSYRVPMVERVESVTFDHTTHYARCIVVNINDLRHMQEKAQGPVGIPTHVAYTYRDHGQLVFFPTPGKALKATMRYIETKEF